jgi:hypothetical protein
MKRREFLGLTTGAVALAASVSAARAETRRIRSGSARPMFMHG